MAGIRHAGQTEGCRATKVARELPSESTAQFTYRLSQQTELCIISNDEEHVVEQLVERVVNSGLQRTLLEKRLNIKLAMEVAQQFEATESSAHGSAGTSTSANGSVHGVKSSGSVSMPEGNVELLVLVTDVVMVVTKRVMLSVLLVVTIVKNAVERDILQSPVKPSQPRRSQRIKFVTATRPVPQQLLLIQVGATVLAMLVRENVMLYL